MVMSTVVLPLDGILTCLLFSSPQNNGLSPLESYIGVYLREHNGQDLHLHNENLSQPPVQVLATDVAAILRLACNV